MPDSARRQTAEPPLAPRRGRFITFEGIDGSGKSSTLAHVVAQLRTQFPDLVATKEETEGPAGQAVRATIAAHGDPLAITLLFVADRASHIPAIEAHLAAGRHVLCDRYSLSTLAYQSVTLRGRVPDPGAFVRALHEPLRLRPDHVLLFVADPARCVARTRKRGATTPYEKTEFLTQVQQAYLREADADPTVHRFDAERPIEAVKADALRLVSSWLGA